MIVVVVIVIGLGVFWYRFLTLNLALFFDKAGDLGDALEFLSLRPDYAEATMLKSATKGVGSSANIVWSIMIGRSNEEMERLKKVYFEVYSKDLGKLLASELHGDMERLVFTCLQGGEEVFDAKFHTKEKAIEDAEYVCLNFGRDIATGVCTF